MFFHLKIFSGLGLGPNDLVRHDDSNDDSEKSEGAAENLNDQHADESRGGLGVSECCSRTDAAD